MFAEQCGDAAAAELSAALTEWKRTKTGVSALVCMYVCMNACKY